MLFKVLRHSQVFWVHLSGSWRFLGALWCYRVSENLLMCSEELCNLSETFSDVLESSEEYCLVQMLFELFWSLLKVQKHSLTFWSVLRSSEAFWDVFFGSKLFWKVSKGSAAFPVILMFSEVFCNVLMDSESFWKILRCSLTFWGILRRSETLSWVYGCCERFLKVLRSFLKSGCSESVWGICIGSA